MQYLRVNSHAAEVTSRGTRTGKEDVNIDRGRAQGTYAIRIAFDDSPRHRDLLLGDAVRPRRESAGDHWQAYLERLAAAGYDRQGHRLSAADASQRRIRVLYFAYLANKMLQNPRT